MAPDSDTRLDKWLWAARFFKTRALAAAAIEGGKIEVNGEKPKRAEAVRPGDTHPDPARALRAPDHGRRGRAAAGPRRVAATLYRRTPTSRAARERLHEQHRLAAAMHGRSGAGPADQTGSTGDREAERQGVETVIRTSGNRGCLIRTPGSPASILDYCLLYAIPFACAFSIAITIAGTVMTPGTRLARSSALDRSGVPCPLLSS